ncbi:hypothetical protein BCV72DRAFT_327917 [Rhizopus microsporus var. microsporus]|uniref:Pyruvate carboxylase n=1 Tax=Rhizopus microsporus var. microsporus TaxID=86635 RepID=A0A1X0R4E8_RHIZD|nr:hypothetical protein BCV72DRAFT_327917 [Rhizopus microsporus var. microsporus]
MVKLLIANRGEIAVRIIQSATELGFETVAVYTNDQDKSHCQKATESVKISSFLNIKEIITVAQRVNATAIHPGYGFLSESADFAEQCEKAKIIFVGPSPQCIKAAGDKVSARQVAKVAGIPVIPGIEQSISSTEVVQFAEDNGGYPVILKARDGGGGRGIRIVHSDQEVPDALTRCTNESPSKQVFVEKAVIGAKHIEVQILGDNKNNVIHLFERDCSIQRRYQKLLEVAPCPCLSPKLRTSIHQAAIRLAHHIGYNSAGTVEFLVLPDSDVFYFLEVNPRIQVEHTISEQITQVDIVQAQIRIALGDTLADLGLSQGVIYSPKQPVAIQARIVSENPLNNNMLSVGKVKVVHFPLGHGIRIDTWIHPGCVVLPVFDSLLAKIIVTGQTFKDAVSKLKLALEETTITGVETNISFLIAVLSDTTFTSDSLSQVHVKTLEEKMDSLVQVTAQLDEQRKRMVSNKRDTETATTATVPSSVQFKPGDAFNIEIADGEEAAVHSLQIDSIFINNFPDELVAITQASTHKQPLSISITKKSGISSTMRRKANSRHQAEVGAPLTGMLVEINVNEGDRVQVGQQLYVISAMKMETVVNSPVSGNVKYIYAKVNDLVESGDLIIELLKPKENKL